MRIAIVGAGVSGSTAAWALSTSTSHEIAVYEASTLPGGHSHTVDVDYDGERLSVDTGFIVFNELNYPNFNALLTHLDVKTERSTMGFSLSSGGGAFEWAGREDQIVSGFFARRRNLLSPRHYRFLFEMFRFNRQAVLDRKRGALGELSLNAYLDMHGYSQHFRKFYLLPMAAAIWSMPMARILDFPASSFIAFFDNHRLLHWNRPAWRTISGGSKRYVERLVAPFRNQMRLGRRVVRVARADGGFTVQDSAGASERFDQVVFATHSDQALACIDEPTACEAAILSAIAYRENRVYLHRDPSLMPKRRAAWASWNVAAGDKADGLPIVTYWMNSLQNIDRSKPIFVSLNPPRPPAHELVFGEYVYAHPQYDRAAVAAQTRLAEIQGVRGLWFCGAWSGYGFHEDGVVSGLRVAEQFGASTPWRSPAVSHRSAVAA